MTRKPPYAVEGRRATWGLTPARWEAQSRYGMFSGRNRHFVVMNNALEVSEQPNRAAAELEAARLNYANGSYQRPAQFGMDGVG